MRYRMGKLERARQDSNLRPLAPEASGGNGRWGLNRRWEQGFRRESGRSDCASIGTGLRAIRGDSGRTAFSRRSWCRCLSALSSLVGQ